MGNKVVDGKRLVSEKEIRIVEVGGRLKRDFGMTMKYGFVVEWENKQSRASAIIISSKSLIMTKLKSHENVNPILGANNSGE